MTGAGRTSAPPISSAAVEERLRRVQSVADAKLSGMDASELLSELLERVREAVGADTGAVLLLDNSSGELVETVASGLEAETGDRVRMPLDGRRFAGRVTDERGPVIIDQDDGAQPGAPAGEDQVSGRGAAAGRRDGAGAAAGRVAGRARLHPGRCGAAAARRGPCRGGRPGAGFRGRPGGCDRAAAQPDPRGHTWYTRGGDRCALRSRHSHVTRAWPTSAARGRVKRRWPLPMTVSRPAAQSMSSSARLAASPARRPRRDNVITTA
jgi:hypothetical protein